MPLVLKDFSYKCIVILMENVYKLVIMVSTLTIKLKNVKIVPDNVELVTFMENVSPVPLELSFIIMNVISTVLKELSNMEIMNVYPVINLVPIVTKLPLNVKFVLMDISCKLPKLYQEHRLLIPENVLCNVTTVSSLFPKELPLLIPIMDTVNNVIHLV